MIYKLHRLIIIIYDGHHFHTCVLIEDSALVLLLYISCRSIFDTGCKATLYLLKFTLTTGFFVSVLNKFSKKGEK